MMQRFLLNRRNMLFSLVGLLVTAMLSIWGCGGSSSYTDPTPTTTNSATIIGAATLKQWINEGKLNAPFGSRDRVVLVSVSSTGDWTTKGHIPGAVRWGSDELAFTRIEGLAAAGSMMPSGAQIDERIKRCGIDGNTTIVISLPKNGTIWHQSLLYWICRYWGFPKDRLKILNGGDDAWVAAGLALATDAVEKYTASTYSVGQNAALKDVVRYSIGEMIAKVDALIATPTLEDEWQIIDVRGTTGAAANYLTNALRLDNYTMFLTRLDADGDGTPDADKNYVYPTEAELRTRMAALDVDDAGVAAFVDPDKKTVVYCTASSSASPSFVLFDAVLNKAEGDIAMYDGSYSQWSQYSDANLQAKYTTATADQIAAWSFSPSTGRSNSLPTVTAPTWDAFLIMYGPGHSSMNQIETEDNAYIVPTTTSTTSGGSSGGGDSSDC